MKNSALYIALLTAACEPQIEVLDEEVDNELDTLDEGKADSLSVTSTYYEARQDFRKCVYPLCGGMWVKRVGRAQTRCADAKWAPECYVAETELPNVTLPAADKTTFVNRFRSGHGLVRGSLASRQINNWKVGVLVGSEAWDAATDAAPTGKVWAVKDRGLRCFTWPCMSMHAARLNFTGARNFSDLNLDPVAAPDAAVNAAYSALTTRAIFAGTFVRIKNAGPGGDAVQLDVSQFYTPTKASGPSCFATGCSGEVCSDQQVFTACVFRPEYACYEDADCAVQANGKCGWTVTPELTQCLAPPAKTCIKTGCSGHVCADQDVITTCEWTADYACYKTAECKVQADGNCGFTQDAALLTCLASN